MSKPADYWSPFAPWPASLQFPVTQDEWKRFHAHFDWEKARDAFEKSGDPRDLERMLSYVTETNPPDMPASQPVSIPRRVPWAAITGLLTWGLVSGLEISGIANRSANRPGVAGSLILSAIFASFVAIVVKVISEAIRQSAAP